MGGLLLSKREYFSECQIDKAKPAVTKGYLFFELRYIGNFAEDKNELLVFSSLINELVLVRARCLL